MLLTVPAAAVLFFLVNIEVLRQVYRATGLEFFNLSNFSNLSTGNFRGAPRLLVLPLLAVLAWWLFTTWRARQKDQLPENAANVLTVSSWGITLPDKLSEFAWHTIALVWRCERNGTSAVCLQLDTGRVAELLFGSQEQAEHFYVQAKDAWDAANARGDTAAARVPAGSLPGYSLRLLVLRAVVLGLVAAALYLSWPMEGTWGIALRIAIACAGLSALCGWYGQIRVVGNEVTMFALGKKQTIHAGGGSDALAPKKIQLTVGGKWVRYSAGLGGMLVLNPGTKVRMAEAWLALAERLSNAALSTPSAVGSGPERARTGKLANAGG